MWGPFLIIRDAERNTEDAERNTEDAEKRQECTENSAYSVFSPCSPCFLYYLLANKFQTFFTHSTCGELTAFGNAVVEADGVWIFDLWFAF